ncbi:hypothetical protein Tco_1204546 [Tanacetum coccineum]
MKAAQDRQRDYTDRKRKPWSSRLRDKVISRGLAVERGCAFSKRGKSESTIRPTFPRCYADVPLVTPLEGINVTMLQFVEERPVEIMEQEIKRLKQIEYHSG